MREMSRYLAGMSVCVCVCLQMKMLPLSVMTCAVFLLIKMTNVQHKQLIIPALLLFLSNAFIVGENQFVAKVCFSAPRENKK